MNRVYNVEVCGRFKYCYQSETNDDFIKRTFTVIATDVENAIEKTKNNLWKVVDGIQSKEEVSFYNLSFICVDIVKDIIIDIY